MPGSGIAHGIWGGFVFVVTPSRQDLKAHHNHRESTYTGDGLHLEIRAAPTGSSRWRASRTVKSWRSSGSRMASSSRQEHRRGGSGWVLFALPFLFGWDWSFGEKKLKGVREFSELFQARTVASQALPWAARSLGRASHLHSTGGHG